MRDVRRTAEAVVRVDSRARSVVRDISNDHGTRGEPLEVETRCKLTRTGCTIIEELAAYLSNCPCTQTARLLRTLLLEQPDFRPHVQGHNHTVGVRLSGSVAHVSHTPRHHSICTE